MVFQAHAHSPVFMRQAVQVGNFPVALLASDLAVDVPLVIKQHVFGHIVDFYPGCWRIGVKVLVFFLYPGVIGNNIFMAVQTLFHRRDSGMIGIGHEGVTILALDLFDPAVNIMTEWDGLLRSDKNLRRRVK